MELENQTTKQAYIHMLTDTLRRKLTVLEGLMGLTEQQNEIISSDTFMEEEFLLTISLKEEQLEKLTQLDDGFEKLYESVKEELAQSKALYKAEILTLQELVSKITDYSVKLQVLEKRNKAKLDTLFARKRQEIRSSRMSSQTAANYYKTMVKQQEAQSFFYDKKN